MLHHYITGEFLHEVSSTLFSHYTSPVQTMSVFSHYQHEDLFSCYVNLARCFFCSFIQHVLFITNNNKYLMFKYEKHLCFTVWEAVVLVVCVYWYYNRPDYYCWDMNATTDFCYGSFSLCEKKKTSFKWPHQSFYSWGKLYLYWFTTRWQ